MRYFTVTAKCGHVGRNCYIPITFPVRAESAAEAAFFTRQMPRVKHHHKDAILSVTEIDRFEYQDLTYVNSFDPYLSCTSRREQMAEYDAIYNRIEEEILDSRVPERTLPEKTVFSGKKRIRNVRRYAKEQASDYAMLEAI